MHSGKFLSSRKPLRVTSKECSFFTAGDPGRSRRFNAPFPPTPCCGTSGRIKNKKKARVFTRAMAKYRAQQGGCSNLSQKALHVANKLALREGADPAHRGKTIVKGLACRTPEQATACCRSGEEWCGFKEKVRTQTRKYCAARANSPSAKERLEKPSQQDRGSLHVVSKLALREGVVPKVGVEPTRGCPHRILSPARLPISPLRRCAHPSRCNR